MAGALLLAALGFERALREPPRLGGGGADLVLALDLSRSMDVEDVAPSRLRRAVRLSRDLVAAVHGARVALVLFAGDAFIALPLTQDRDAVDTYLRALDTEILSARGTDLERALRVSAGAFDPASSRARSLVLLSDGEHGGGGVDSALAALRSAGVRVTAVGLGTEAGGVVVSGASPLSDEDGSPVVSRRSDALLRKVAAGTGGTYLRELEDAPSGARLLPAPGPGPDEPGVRAPTTSALCAAGAALLLALEILASLGRGGSRLRLRAPLLAAAAVPLLGAGLGGWLAEGDSQLEAGDANAALRLYQRAERASGSTPYTRIRVANALYRLKESDRAAGVYLDALRLLRSAEAEARYVASFNLGDALLRLERWSEARDAFWAALLERPDDLRAKFNYEWAMERLQAAEPPPVPSPPPQADPRASSSELPETEPVPRPDPPPDMGEAEARRWLESIREPVTDALERQLREAGATRAPEQTW